MKFYYTVSTNFYGNTNPEELILKYGSPLYVYNEHILRQRCRDMVRLVDYPHFKAGYSVKANSNIHLLKVILEEGLNADAMSPGEIFLLLKAGFNPNQILYVSNNVSVDEMKFAVDNNITVSIDSLSQLELFGRTFPGSNVAIRFNPGIGAGHNEKVITGGKKTKFGVNIDLVPQVKDILKRYKLKLIGINQHIGSLFMEGEPYLKGAKSILDTAKHFDDLDFVDLGGGFGIPYHKQQGEKSLNIDYLRHELNILIDRWVKDYGKEITFKTQPGRYVIAECGVLLGRVHAIKQNGSTVYVGTDIGFNNLMRPVLYDSYHELEIYRKGNIINSDEVSPVTIVGNICESGDIIAKNRPMPPLCEGDIIGVMDTGAYGYSMSSNYNSRLKPAEVLINENGEDILIRRRDTLEDLIRNFYHS